MILPKLFISQAESRQLLERQIWQGQQLMNTALDQQAAHFEQWHADNLRLLRLIFDSPLMADFYAAVSQSFIELEPNTVRKQIAIYLGRLDSIIDRLPFFSVWKFGVIDSERK